MDVLPTHTCFDDALDFVDLLFKAHPDKSEDFLTNLIVVHAICLLEDGTPYAHAWVEDKKEDECIFGGIVNGEKMYLRAGTADYYENFQVQETTKYTLKQVALENLLSKSYGPWEEKYKALQKDKK